jgi:FkbM family methyltransferase
VPILFVICYFVVTDTLRLHDTPTGRWWLPDRSGDIIAAAIAAGGIYDAAVVEEAYHHIRPGTQVLDLGANFGQMAVLFARHAGRPSGMIHAFEAEPFVADTLQRNVSENAANVKVYNRAVWHTGGISLVFPPPDFVRFDAWGNYGIEPDMSVGRSIQSLAIDDLALYAPISFMKVDVQGADLFAMQGARQTIARHRMSILFEFEPQFQEKFGTCWNDYERFIGEIGYAITKIVDGCNYLIMPV